MTHIFRIIFSLITLLACVVVGYMVFFVSPTQSQIPVLEDFEGSTLSGGILVQSFSDYEYVYTDNQDIEQMSFSGETLSLDKPGRYVTSMRGMGYNYAFSGTGYTLRQTGIGEVYIDTQTKPGKVFVYPINTPIEIDLVSDTGEEVYTTAYLAPGMYLEFQPSRGRFLKGADRLRIATVFNLGYIGSKFEKSENSYLTQETSILGESLHHIDEHDIKKQEFISQIKGVQTQQVAGVSYIQRYMNLFVNDNKKKIFYQNIILSGLLDVLNGEQIELSTLSQIRSDLLKLKNLDLESYSRIISLKGDIYASLLSQKDIKYIHAKIHFTQLYNPKFQDQNWNYPLYSYVFFSPDGTTMGNNTGSMKDFLLAFQEYSFAGDDTSLPYDYFSYFLQQNLYSFLEITDKVFDISNINEIGENYIRMSESANYTSTNQKITQIFSVVEVLQALEQAFGKQYFMQERNSQNLLILHPSNILEGREFARFSDLMNALNAIYDNNVGSLDQSSSRDTRIQQDMEIVRAQMKEYIAALGNYQRYQNEYDTRKNTLLNIASLTDSDEILDRDVIQTYLSRFKGIDLNAANIDIFDEYYASVKNVSIGGDIFDFELYPFESYKLAKISINGQVQSSQYKLGNIEQDWGERFRSAPVDQRDVYDFSRFFILTFYSSQQSRGEIFINDIQMQEEQTEIVFKRDILLGDEGEFRWVKDFMNIQYDDIILSANNDGYDISLSNVDVSKTINRDNRDIEITGIITSDYTLNQQEHYFSNFQMILERENASSFGVSSMRLGGTPILFGGNIFIRDLESIVGEFLQSVNLVESVYNTVTETTGNIKIDILYNPQRLSSSINFEFMENRYTIQLDSQSITGVFKNGIPVVRSNISPMSLGDYIK